MGVTILLAMDQFDNSTNGTTVSARRFAEQLRLRGHTVRVIGTGSPGPDKFVLPRKNIPLVSAVAEKQGIVFAQPVKEVIRSALQGVDVMHLYLPFPMEKAVAEEAEKMGIPRLAAYHLQAENITYFIGLGKSRLAARLLYRFFYRYFFRRFSHIHCPSQFIADELAYYGFRASFHVISNGISPDFTYQTPVPHEGFHILMTGRLAPEKRQDVLLKAVRLSKYRDSIHLWFAGGGPLRKKYGRMGKKLPNPPVFFRFGPNSELLERMARCDLYVHTSEVEIESLACMEGFAAGLVPLIANARTSATRYFALDSRSLFEAGNPQDLAEKIDWWIEHPQERAEAGRRYAGYAKQFSLARSVEKIETVYRLLLEEKHHAQKPEKPRNGNPASASSRLGRRFRCSRRTGCGSGEKNSGC